MKTNHRNTVNLVGMLSWLTKEYMPDALWTVEGAFRFDRSIYNAAKHLATSVIVRKITRVAGAPACLWSLDWFSQRRPMELNFFTQLLDAYSQHGVAVNLTYDNPHIRDEDLTDPYPLRMIAELMQRNSSKVTHSVSVASDSLAQHLRTQFPYLSIHCHVNRLLAMRPEEPRTAKWYDQLGELYQRVCLHPQDAVNPAVYSAIANPDRVDVIVNSPCLRSCPARGEHLQILSDCRYHPYDTTHLQRRVALLRRIGCLNAEHNAPQQKQTDTLTKAECQNLYDSGYRSFIIQAQQFRNEITLLWDICQCMFSLPPEQSNKQALLNATLMPKLLPDTPSLASGLTGFSSSSYT